MERDRISQVCDDILLLILDKIDTPEGVKTSILSKRWKNLWRSLPSLRLHVSLAADLNLEDFYFPTESVSQLLSHRPAAAAVRDFHLSYDGHIPPYPRFNNRVAHEFTEECVLYALNHGVRSLRLHWPTLRQPRLPAAFLACHTLRELDLRNFWRIPFRVPGRLSLPNLKTFRLQTLLLFADDHEAMEPFSGLPELDKLTLVGPTIDKLVVIKSPKLRVLEIEECYLEQLNEISAPLLTSFRYKYCVPWRCSKVNLPMLEQVHLDIHLIAPIVHDNFGEMLHQFGNATIVSLNLDTILVLSYLFDSFEHTPPPFPNIRILKVMEGRYNIHTMLQRVIDHLTRSSNCEVELSLGLSIGEEMSNRDNYLFRKLTLFNI